MKYCPQCGKENTVMLIAEEEDVSLTLYCNDETEYGRGESYLYEVTEGVCLESVGGCGVTFYLPNPTVKLLKGVAL